MDIGELDLASLREEYARGGLDLPDLEPDPLTMFRRWLGEAVAAGLHEPNALVVATATPDTKVSGQSAAAQDAETKVESERPDGRTSTTAATTESASSDSKGAKASKPLVH